MHKINNISHPQTFTQNDGNVPKQWKESVNKEILSITVQGNPWIVYPEPQYKVIEFLLRGRRDAMCRQKGKKVLAQNLAVQPPPSFLFSKLHLHSVQEVTPAGGFFRQ